MVKAAIISLKWTCCLISFAFVLYPSCGLCVSSSRFIVVVMINTLSLLVEFVISKPPNVLMLSKHPFVYFVKFFASHLFIHWFHPPKFFSLNIFRTHSISSLRSSSNNLLHLMLHPSMPLGAPSHQKWLLI